MGKAKRLWLFLSLSMVIAWMLMMRPVLAEEAAPQAAEPQAEPVRQPVQALRLEGRLPQQKPDASSASRRGPSKETEIAAVFLPCPFFHSPIVNLS